LVFATGGQKIGNGWWAGETGDGHGSDLFENAVAFDLHRKGLQVDAGGQAPGLAGPVFELAVVFGAFDHMVRHQAIAKVHIFMRAATQGAIGLVIRRAANGKTCPAMAGTGSALHVGEPI
jgi:hypothetical protein